MTQTIIVIAAFDRADGQWTAASRDLAGLRFTADTWTQLIEQLPTVVRARLANSASCRRREVSVEVLLHASLSVTVEANARYHVGMFGGPSRLRSDGGEMCARRSPNRA